MGKNRQQCLAGKAGSYLKSKVTLTLVWPQEYPFTDVQKLKAGGDSIILIVMFAKYLLSVNNQVNALHGLSYLISFSYTPSEIEGIKSLLTDKKIEVRES